MNALEKNIAVARGEAVGASLLAAAALRTVFMMAPPQNRKQLLASINALIPLLVVILGLAPRANRSFMASISFAWAARKNGVSPV